MGEADATADGTDSWTLASYAVNGLPSSSPSPLSDLQRHLDNQQQSLRQLMTEWDGLIDFVRSFDRKFIPRAVLLRKLESLRPF